MLQKADSERSGQSALDCRTICTLLSELDIFSWLGLPILSTAMYINCLII